MTEDDLNGPRREVDHGLSLSPADTLLLISVSVFTLPGLQELFSSPRTLVLHVSPSLTTSPWLAMVSLTWEGLIWCSP
jgi:hypothetical protein